MTKATLLKTEAICGPTLLLMIDGVIFQCRDVIISYNTWWCRTPMQDESGWTQVPYREFLQLKGLILDSNQKALEKAVFFVSFCNKFGIGRGPYSVASGPTGERTRRDEIDASIGRVSMYASRLYTFCMSELERLESAPAPDGISRQMLAVTATQLMRECLLMRTALMSGIPTLLSASSSSVDCFDFLFVHFNQHLIDLSEITIQYNYLLRNF